MLKKKGYSWPNEERIQRAMNQHRQPEGYQHIKEGKEQICQTLAEMKKFAGEWMLTNKKAPWATMARGTQRKHKVGACQSHHVLSNDLAGPSPPCLGEK